MKELRVRVERIVRPIRASVVRKNRMREELLAHLRTAYEEERVRFDTEEEAVARAAERLGEPGRLREELQASVPWIERIGVTYFALRLEPDSYGQDESFGWRGASRLATNIVLLVALLKGLATVVYTFAIPDSAYAWTFGAFATVDLAMFALLLCALWLAFFVTNLAFDRCGARKTMSAWTDTAPFMKAVLSLMHTAIAVAIFLFMAIGSTRVLIREQEPTAAMMRVVNDARSVPAWIWMGSLALALMYSVHVKRRDRRQYEAWGSLDIDSGPAK